MFTFFGLLFGALITGLVSAFSVSRNTLSQEETNQTNRQIAEETNQANLQAVRETNSSNVEQANIAYQRSLPTAQVRNLMSAGMSKAGALNKLSGGGVYTPPALGTATMQSSTQQPIHYDYSGIAEAIDKLGNIPSSVQQSDIQRQQLEDLRQEAQLRHNEEMRKQEQHDFNMWRERYGKKTAELLDGVSSKVVQVAADKGYDLSSAKTVQKVMRDLGLENDADYRNMPHMARLQLFDAIKSQNDQLIEQESHEANMLAAKLDSKLKDVNLQQLVEDYKNSVKEHKTQDKERYLRDLNARISSILAEDNLSLEDFRHSLEFNKDGSIKFSRKVSERAKRAWDRLADTIGIGVLKDLLRGVVSIAK